MDEKIPYTARDYQTVRQALIDWIKLRLPKDWPEFVDTSVGMAILNLVALAHAQRAYYYDVQARNCYLETADLPEAVMALARQLGYARRLATAASVPVTLYPTPAQAIAVTIPKGSQVLVDDITFEASDTYVIPANNSIWPSAGSTELIVFVEGETKTEEFLSDGTIFQSFALSSYSIIEGSIVVTVLDEEWESVQSLVFVEGTGQGRDTFLGDGEDNQTYELSLLHALLDPNDEDVVICMVDGEHWALVDDFTGAPKEFRATQDVDGVTTIRFGTQVTYAAPGDESVIDVIYQVVGAQKRYVVDLARSGRATIRFGDGVNGLIPEDGATIEVSYRTGGGVRGNVRRGRLDGNVRGVLPSGAEINVRVYNHEAGSGGEEIESLESIKFLAPRYAAANQRAVTKADYDILALTYRDPRYGAPAFASAKLKQRIPERNEVQVALWSRDSLGRVHPATSPLKQGVKSFLDARRTICTYVEMVDGDILYFDITAQVMLKGGRTISSILDPITTVLRQHFNSTFVTPGTDLALSLIIDKILSIAHVELVTLERVQGSRIEEINFGIGDDVNKDFTNAFTVPDGVEIVPESFELTDGTQTINDDGNGSLIGDIDDTDPTKNVINYETGKFIACFLSPPTSSVYVTAEARIEAYMANEDLITLTENEIDGVAGFFPIVNRRQIGFADGLSINKLLPQEFLPFTPNRLLFIGGFDFDGTQPGGNLLAYDDGYGNIVGDVAAGGEVNYDTGLVTFSWNTMPPPITYTDYWGYLDAVPDGTTRTFGFVVRTAPAGGGTYVNFNTLQALGRLKFVLSDLTTINVTFYDGWDDGFSHIDGPSNDTTGENEIVYEDPGLLYSLGTITFNVAPEAASGRDFKIQVAPVTLFLYTPFCAFIAGSSGYDKVLMADHRGRYYGTVANAFPYAQLDHLSGRYKAELPAPSEVGRIMTISFDTYVLSNNKDIPISHLTMPTFSRAILTELVREVNI